MDRLSSTEALKQQLRWLIASWDKFFFQPVDALPLCFLRILAGSMLLYTHSVWGSVLEEFFGPDGWNTAEVVALSRQDGIFPSLWWYVPVDSMHLVHHLCSAVIVLSILGIGGRVTSLATWFIAISYAHRASPANFGLDQINCMLAMYLTIGPSTQFLSLDRWIRMKLGRSTEKLDQLSVSANVAMRLIQLNFCVIYLWAGLGKLQGESWWNGNAIWLALASYEYQSMDLTWLARYPRLLEFLTHATIAWEIAFSFLVWPKPTRWIMLSIGIGMHLGIGLFLGMWTFGSIMIFSYIAFGSGAWIRSRFETQEAIAEDESATQVGLTESVLDPEGKAPLPRPVEEPSTVLPSNILPNVAQRNLQEVTGTKETVVLITDSQRCIHHFLKLNRQSDLNWIVAANIKEAEKLVRICPESTFLLLEMRSISDQSELEYLSIRTLRVKRSKKTSTDKSSHSDRRTHPK